MNNLNYQLVIDMALDLQDKCRYLHLLNSIWRYMNLLFNNPIHTIVIGQNPYPDYLVPHLGAAFSQVATSKDTPTATIFGQRFKDSCNAVYMLRNSWSLLSKARLSIWSIIFTVPVPLQR